jgi:hypothetical protein
VNGQQDILHSHQSYQRSRHCSNFLILTDCVGLVLRRGKHRRHRSLAHQECPVTAFGDQMEVCQKGWNGKDKLLWGDRAGLKEIAQITCLSL